MHQNYLDCILKHKFLGPSQGFRVGRSDTPSCPQYTLKMLNPISISSFHAIINTPCSFFWAVWIPGQTFTSCQGPGMNSAISITTAALPLSLSLSPPTPMLLLFPETPPQHPSCSPERPESGTEEELGSFPVQEGPQPQGSGLCGHSSTPGLF